MGMHHKFLLRPPAWQPTLSKLPLSQIHEITQLLFRLRGAGDASDAMPLEVAHGAHPAKRLHPPDRRIGPLVGLSASETSIDPSGMGLKIADQSHGAAHTLRIDRFVGIPSTYSCGNITAFNISFYPQHAALSGGDLNGDRCADRMDARLLLADPRSPGPHHPAYDLNEDDAVDLGTVRTLFVWEQG
jgi:hypothetical protein